MSFDKRFDAFVVESVGAGGDEERLADGYGEYTCRDGSDGLRCKKAVSVHMQQSGICNFAGLTVLPLILAPGIASFLAPTGR